MDLGNYISIVYVYLQNTLRIAKGKKMPSAGGIKNVVRMGIVTDQINLVRVLGEYVHVEGKHAMQGTFVIKTKIVVISHLSQNLRLVNVAHVKKYLHLTHLQKKEFANVHLAPNLI